MRSCFHAVRNKSKDIRFGIVFRCFTPETGRILSQLRPPAGGRPPNLRDLPRYDGSRDILSQIYGSLWPEKVTTAVGKTAQNQQPSKEYTDVYPVVILPYPENCKKQSLVRVQFLEDNTVAIVKRSWVLSFPDEAPGSPTFDRKVSFGACKTFVQENETALIEVRQLFKEVVNTPCYAKAGISHGQRSYVRTGNSGEASHFIGQRLGVNESRAL